MGRYNSKFLVVLGKKRHSILDMKSKSINVLWQNILKRKTILKRKIFLKFSLELCKNHGIFYKFYSVINSNIFNSSINSNIFEMKLDKINFKNDALNCNILKIWL